MRISNPFTTYNILSLLALGALPARVFGDQTLKTSGFSSCLQGSNITVNNVDIQYNKDNQTVTFNVAGQSTQATNVTAVLTVTAYGNQIYTKEFNPCNSDTYVEQLCPVPSGSFSASGTQAIPSSYESLVPSIAFQIPDIAAEATLQLNSPTTGKSLACIRSNVSNGKTFSVPAISYVAMGIAGVALVIAGVSALSAAAAGGTAAGSGTMSPSFAEIIGWFQGIAVNGMYSVNYPLAYRAWTKNFAFSAGIIPWTKLQTSIDGFRTSTGGNLTNDNVQILQNATLIFTDDTNSNSTSTLRRAIGSHINGVTLRDVTTNVNSSSGAANDTSALSQIELRVSGVTAYVEQLAVPQANTFMTALLIAGIITAVIVISILLFKLILEFWALFGSFPKSLTGFRKHYWGTMARSIVQLILILYGIWVLYCVFEFTHGDSWAAKVLAGVTLAAFTGVLAFFAIKILLLVRKSKETEGDVSLLYEDKKTWLKYSLFYDSYRKNYWWAFLPLIIYMLTKGVALAATDGHGMTQTITQLAIEGLMLIFLLFSRPYERRSGNIINVVIQVVRALSVICILVFVEQLGIAQTTQTITGVVLIVVQAVLTAILAILLIANAFIICCKVNPHRKRRKEAEKLSRDMDDLTPLDARNSLLKGPANRSSTNSWNSEPKYPLLLGKGDTIPDFVPRPPQPFKDRGATPLQDMRSARALESREGLVEGAAPLAGGLSGRLSQSPPRSRERVPSLPGYAGYRGVGY